MSAANTVILHADMDAFYASVEERDNPTLRGKAVVVGNGIRGVVSAANYEARKFGIHSAMPVSQARRLAPHAHFLPVRHERYSEVSAYIMEIFESISPLVEPLSVDEAFIDVTGAQKLLGTPRQIGELIRKRVFESQGLTCSVGIAPNKFLAKLASGRCKPNGLLEIQPDRILEFLHPLPVAEIWGVGPKTNQELLNLGLRTISDIAQTPLTTLTRALGESLGRHLYELSWGRDERDVSTYDVEKSISAAETFDTDIEDQETLQRELLRLIERASSRMRAREMMTARVSIKVRFSDFRTITRSKTIDLPISTSADIFAVAKHLYQSLKLDRARIRLLGISLESLLPEGESAEQLLLGAREKGWLQATEAIDIARERFGEESVTPASLLPPSNASKGPRKLSRKLKKFGDSQES
jgi:DNA polymerase IV